MTVPPSHLIEAVAHLRNIAVWESRHHRFKSVDVSLAMLLAIADADGGIALKHLYGSSPCAMPTAVNWIKRFVERGWVEFFHDGADRRVRRVGLTAAGQMFLQDYCDALKGRNP